MPDFGSRLRKHRQALSLTRSVLAWACGISEGMQDAYETGNLRPDRQYLQALNSLGMDVRYLTTGEFSPVLPQGLNEGEFTFLLNYRCCNSEGQAQIALSLMIAAAPMRERLAQDEARIRREQFHKAANDAEFE